MTEREEMLALALQDWLNYAEDNLSEFDLEECFADAETTLCPRCQISGCINLKIRTARSALSAFKDSAQDSALRSAARTGPDVAGFEACRLLTECRQFIADSGCDEDDSEVNRQRNDLLKRIDGIAALPSPARESVTEEDLIDYLKTADKEWFCEEDAARSLLSAFTITRKSEARS